MRPVLLLALLLLTTIGVRADADKLVVHEWGTFTSFAGSDGVYLDYRTRVGGDLPGFVLDRRRQTAPSALVNSDLGFLLSKRTASLSRMETPVTYFYTDKPMSVTARVGFPRGVFTEFYPPVVAMAPGVTPEEKAGKAVPDVADGLLDWGTIRLTPAAGADVSKIPPVTTGDRYAAARETDSDVVQTTDARTGVVAQEKFLFYRGICNIDLPLAMKSLGHDRFELTDAGKTPIAAAFLVEVRGERVRFVRYGDIKGPRSLALPSEVSSLEALGSAMTRELIAAGLYEKEARAMVATWQSTWFGEDGTRLLYLLPQAMTEGVIPLRITPTPEKTLRVMGGRLEALTPEREAELTEVLRGQADVKAFGRFAEPILTRVATTSTDVRVKANAKAMLAGMK